MLVNMLSPWLGILMGLISSPAAIQYVKIKIWKLTFYTLIKNSIYIYKYLIKKIIYACIITVGVSLYIDLNDFAMNEEIFMDTACQGSCFLCVITSRYMSIFIITRNK